MSIDTKTTPGIFLLPIFGFWWCFMVFLAAIYIALWMFVGIKRSERFWSWAITKTEAYNVLLH